jgi:Protein of unknown function (DUF1189)
MIDPQPTERPSEPTLFPVTTQPVIPAAPATQPQAASGGCLNEFLWLGLGAILPCASLTFYRQSIRRKTILAMVFFVLFGIAISLVTGAGVDQAFTKTLLDAQSSSFLSGFPTITIKDGIALVDGSQPFYLFNQNGELFAIDTAGTLKNIDTTQYRVGFLLTRTYLQVLQTGGQVQNIRLAEFNEMFNMNPIVIDRDNLLGLLHTGLTIVWIIILILLVLWNTLCRLLIILLMGLVFWGATAAFRNHTDFAPVLITGIYTFVPAVYLDFLIGQATVRFLGTLTLIHFFLWAIALFFLFHEMDKYAGQTERPLRAWRAAIGIPMLVVIILQAVYSWTWGAGMAWGVTVVTLIAWGVIGYLGLKSGEVMGVPPMDSPKLE